MKHVNQKIAITIKGDTDLVLIEPEKTIQIAKDLSDDPNEATVELFNLNAETRSAIKQASDRQDPIEIAISPLGSEELYTAYKGEIQSAKSVSTRPGMLTTIRCTSQKRSHRAAYISEKTYAKGTTADVIIKEFTDAIALPVSFRDEDMPKHGILLAHSFSGPAFVLLQRFLSDYGMFAYIDDGVLNISDVYEALGGVVVTIDPSMLIAEVNESTRTDKRETTLHTITEKNAIDPFQKKRRQKKNAPKKEIGKNDYVKIEAVDVIVPSVEIPCFYIPNLVPDCLVSVDNGKTHFRVFNVNIWGDDTRGGERPTMQIRADRYEGGI